VAAEFLVDEIFLKALVRADCGNGCHVCHEPFAIGDELGFSAKTSEHPSSIVVHKRCSGKRPGAYITPQDLAGFSHVEARPL
jgi:hypothetical protein